MAPSPRYSLDDLARRWGMSPDEITQHVASAFSALKVCVAAEAPGVISRLCPDGIRHNSAWLTGNFLVLPAEVSRIAAGDTLLSATRRPDPEPSMAYGDPRRPPVVGLRFDPPLEVRLDDLFVRAVDLERYERVETAH